MGVGVRSCTQRLLRGLKGCCQWRQKSLPATPHQIPPMQITIRCRHIWPIWGLKLHLPAGPDRAQTSHCSVMNALWLFKTRHVCGLRGVLACRCIHRWATAKALRANRVIALFMHSHREVNAFFMYSAETSYAAEGAVTQVTTRWWYYLKTVSGDLQRP